MKDENNTINCNWQEIYSALIILLILIKKKLSSSVPNKIEAKSNIVNKPLDNYKKFNISK